MSTKVYKRIPFEEAINEPLLFKRAFYGNGTRDEPGFSLPQQVVLKAIYGLPLSLTELEIWYALNGYGVYDSLGFLTGTNGTFAYAPCEAQDITLVLGRRAGKSSLTGFISAYEALCGGHKAFVGVRQDPIVLQVAQDLLTARMNLRQFILPILESSPIGKAELGNINQSVTAEEIRLKSALIRVGPPTIKLRGQAIAIGLLDEIGVWAKDHEAANPDYEVETAIRPAQLQFPNRKLMKLGTPMVEEGLLWEATRIGTYGRFKGGDRPRVLVLHGPTALLENPRYSPEEVRAYIQQERTKDRDAFRREYLAEFAKSVSGFLSPTLLRAAVSTGVRQQPPKAGVQYVATLDPAFRRDAFAFAIGHLDCGVHVLDHLKVWKGTKDNPESPTRILAEVATTCRAYRVNIVTSDQYQLEALRDLADEHKLVLEGVTLTNKVKNVVFGHLSSMLSQGRMQLLDDPDLLDELMKLEKRLSPSGVTSQITGVRDDRAMVLALNIHRALQWGEQRVAAAPPEVPKSTLVEQRIHARVGASSHGAWWSQ